MGTILFKTPELNNPVLLACWPGIGNIGLLAVDTIRDLLQAEEIGCIEPRDFFYPKRVVIKEGELVSLDFPASKFYCKRTVNGDFLFFIGEEQPVFGNRPYAEGLKAYDMANLVIDVAVSFGCKNIFTSGAAVTNIHHTARSRVWAVPNNPSLLAEIKNWDNTVLMSQIENRDGQGSITGLNGLLLGVAKRRGIDAICIMGEIPVYLQGFPVLYPKASMSVMALLSSVLKIEIDLKGITEFAMQSEREINNVYEKLPPEAKAQLDELVLESHDIDETKFNITDEDKKKILEEVDKFFKKPNPREGEN